jgi:hypothetical protein
MFSCYQFVCRVETKIYVLSAQMRNLSASGIVSATREATFPKYISPPRNTASTNAPVSFVLVALIPVEPSNGNASSKMPSLFCGIVVKCFEKLADQCSPSQDQKDIET